MSVRRLVALAALFALLVGGSALAGAPSVAGTAGLLFAADDHHPPEGGDEGKHDEGKHKEGEHGKGDDGHHEEGPLTIRTDLALWTLIVFLVLLGVLRAFAWGPIVNGLDARESSIRADIAAAQADRTKAAQERAEIESRLKSVEDEIREMRSEARAAADKMKQDAVAAGKEEAAALVEKARGEIERDSRQAREQLKNELAAKVVDAAEILIGRKMNDGDEQRIADEALAQFADAVN